MKEMVWDVFGVAGMKMGIKKARQGASALLELSI